MELKKKFPHDMVLQKMIKEEFKENRVFKYPEEYDLFDDDEDQACKQLIEKQGLEYKDYETGKKLREEFKVKDGQELYYENKNNKEQRMKEKEFENAI